jgi:hypothetical protein
MKVEQQAEDIELLQELILGLDLEDDTNNKQESRGDSGESQEDDGDKMNTGMLWSLDEMGDE